MKESSPKKFLRFVIVFLALLAVAGGVIGGIALADPHDNRILDGVTVGGLDVGGMTPSEAADALRTAALETVLVQEMTVSLPKQTLHLSPYELGMELQVQDAVAAAFRVGRREDATVYEIGLLPYLTLNRDAIRNSCRHMPTPMTPS